MNPLDRPVWASLSTAHAPLSEGDALARRYAPDINRFAAACDDGAAAQAALAALVQPSEQVYLLQVADIVVPSGLTAVKLAEGVQLVARAPVAPPAAGGYVVVPLGDADAAEMLALATLTEPGPFLSRTHRMGSFVGIRVDGRLAAMAGERFRFPGHTEVSGVCTHPDFRGHGFAKQLSRHVAAGIAARGETAFLHAWKHNTGAIALYEALGFAWRTDVRVAVLEHHPRA
ncbi:GNAT family N-acetyltransferase [Pseudoxanthomonas sp.]|uniref:GNAT family N-acetyltransferase n=1 Tax=Pseudoxanthomonas sp. TaxID=1871049 RepID=UPI0026339B81|nr:GNAT family N-acetyltransferase [Pseudoxanthomonas sp.]WDS34717.1 MAG: GNAT family N-acetyltransferase [Pseudoxanthomonas sp.]